MSKVLSPSCRGALDGRRSVDGLVPAFGSAGAGSTTIRSGLYVLVMFYTLWLFTDPSHSRGLHGLERKSR
jgi:hypothetical protein